MSITALPGTPSAGPTPGERLAARARAPRAGGGGRWGRLSVLYTERAHRLSGDERLLVTIAPGLATDSYGRCWPAQGRIELSGELLGDVAELDDVELGTRLALVEGILRHEIGHAEHTRLAPFAATPLVGTLVGLLEEIRMEARVVESRPADAEWIRGSAAATFVDPPSGGELLGAVWVACMTEGRVAAGTLQAGDVAELRVPLGGILGEDLHATLDGLWPRVCAVPDGDTPGLVALAEELAGHLGGEDPSEGTRGLEDLLTAAAREILEERTAGSGKGDGSGEAASPEGAARDALLDDLVGELCDALLGSDGRRVGTRTAGRAGGTRTQRRPSPVERVQRRRVARALLRARVRDRHTTVVPDVLPPGRLNTRAALTADAEAACGLRPSAQPWRRKRRRTVESPRLRLAVLVDASGSMGPYIDEACGALWAIAAAVTDNGGVVRAGAFGERAEPLPAGAAAGGFVPLVDADGGWEAIADGLDLTCGGITGWDGPRLVVILSDGEWVDPTQDRDGRAHIARLRAAGVAVVHVGIGRAPRDCGATSTVTIAGPEDLPAVVAGACVAALARA